MLFPFSFAKNNILKQRTLLSGCTMHYNSFLNKSLVVKWCRVTAQIYIRAALHFVRAWNHLTNFFLSFPFFLLFLWWTQPKKQPSDRLCSVAAHNILPVPEGHSTPSNRRNKQNQLRTECLLPLCVAGMSSPRGAEVFFFLRASRYVSVGSEMWWMELMLISSSWQ